MEQKYNIVRFYRAPSKKREIIKREVSLEEAREHCNDPATKKEGSWFDGFEKA